MHYLSYASNNLTEQVTGFTLIPILQMRGNKAEADKPVGCLRTLCSWGEICGIPAFEYINPKALRAELDMNKSVAAASTP